MSASFDDRPTVWYRLALLAVAVGMAVLPCLYPGLTALVAIGVYLFATRCFAAVWAWPVGMNRYAVGLKVVCSCTPLLVGGAVFAVMVKPLFARRGKPTRPHALVTEVCRIVGAPALRRIELSCDLNASASLERGWAGFFGNRLALILGIDPARTRRGRGPRVRALSPERRDASEPAHPSRQPLV